MFYFTAGTLVVCFLVVIFFLEVKVEKNTEKFIPSFKKIINPASGVFLILVFALGITVGIEANYVLVYLGEDLGATSTMIGMSSFLFTN